jgi:type I restriction enzyme, S subunit
VTVNEVESPIPQGWTVAPLAQFTELVTYGFTNPMPTTESGPFMVTAKDIRGGKIDYAGARHTSSVAYETKLTDKSRPKIGDVLLTKDGSIGRVAVCDRDYMCINQSVALLRTNPLIDSRFLCYLLQAPFYQERMERDSGGSTIKHIYITRVDKMPIMVPSRTEQLSISSVLGALDDKVAVNERIAATARQLGLALFAHALLADDLVQADVESVSSALTRGIAPKYSESPEGLVVLNQKCIRDGRVNLDPARRTMYEKVKAPKLLHRNDVLVNSTGVGTLGRVARWTSDDAATADSHITIVRFAETHVDPVCGGFALLRAQPEIELMGEGSTGQTELRRAQLGGLKITLPNRKQQQQLRPKLDALEEQADQALAESLTLATLRDTLLPQLMSGRLRVKDAEKIVEDHT